MKPPAFRFYADDFLAGTLDLSQADVGAYVRLLCHQWNRGSIPVEPEKQHRLAGGSVSVDVLAKFRVWEDGMLRNDRLESERAQQDQFRAIQSEKGKKSGISRKEGTGVQPGFNRGSTEPPTEDEPNHQPKTNPPLPLPLPKEKKKRRDSKPDMTDEQWLEYMKAKPELQRIDVGREYGKMLEWCQRKNEKPTRRRFEIWVGKAEPGLELAAKPTADQRGPFTPQPHRGLHTWEDYDNLMASL